MAHWSRELGLSKPMQEFKPSPTAINTTTPINNCTNNTSNPPTKPQQLEAERKERPQASSCPRCNSTNTKFCYYNNYSLTQPRYFCKSCRRYWTAGGSLRNVPVGGGSRKNKRSSSSFINHSSSTAPTTTATVVTTVMASGAGIDKKLPCELMFEGQDLNLSFTYPKIPDFNGNSNHNSSGLAFPFPRGGGFMQMGTQGYPSTFGVQEFRPAGGMSFTLDGNGGVFPFEDLKPGVSASGAGFDQFGQNRGQAGGVPGYWNGMIGGGGSWVG